jgi:hypothetical protein
LTQINAAAPGRARLQPFSAPEDTERVQMSETDQTTEERIRVRAYHLWLADGCPEGREMEFWERAKELQGIIDNPTSGQLPNPMTRHHGEIQPELPVEEAELMENLGEFPSRLTDQGDRPGTPMAAKKPHKT